MQDSKTFQPTIIDLSLRDIKTMNGFTVTLCQVEANVPFKFSNEGCGQIDKGTYSLGRVVEPRCPLELDVGVFCLVIVNCGDHMGVFAVAHPVPEDPTFQTSVIVGDEVLVVKPSNISIDQIAAFDFIWFDSTHRLRIETIPNIEAFYKQALPADRQRAQRKQEQKGE